MKTEVKMGLAVGLALLAIVAAAYFFDRHPQGAAAPGTPSPTASTPAPQPSVAVPAKAPEPTPDITITTPSVSPSGMMSSTPSPVTPAPTTETVAPATTMAAATEPAAMFTPPPVPAPEPSAADWNAILMAKNGGASASGPDRSSMFAPPSDSPTGPRLGNNHLPSFSGSQPAAPGSTYTIKKGDTLSIVSTAVYGDANLWAKIAAANPGVSSSHLKIGQVLKIPPVSDVKPTTAEAPKHVPVGGSSLVKDPASEYSVQQGDTLTRIASKLYGNGNRWEEIYNLNKAKIGDSPTRLKIGMVLKLPAAPKTPSTLPAR